MMLSILLIIVGFAALIYGANWLVNGASSLARKYKVSDLVIGLTIVAFGTSAPELVVNSLAALQDSPDIVLGNVIGSNNFNLFIILAIAALIYPVAVQSTTVWREIPISLLTVVLLLLLGNNFFTAGQLSLSRLDGFIMLAAFLGFLYYVFKQMKSDTQAETMSYKQMSTLKVWAMILGGLAGLIIGGKLVVDNSILVAASLGVSEKIIGLTIVAAGTSLPELVTSVIAAIKKNSDIAIGNVIGSNIFNILLILPISTLINPVRFNPNFNTDLYILGGGTLFLFVAMFSGRKKKLDRWEAAIFIAFYLIYTGYLIWKEV